MNRTMNYSKLKFMNIAYRFKSSANYLNHLSFLKLDKAIFILRQNDITEI